MASELSACRLCGSPARELVFFQSKVFDRGATFYTCSSSAALKGSCRANLYFTPDAWNNEQDVAAKDTAAITSLRSYIQLMEDLYLTGHNSNAPDETSLSQAAHNAIRYLEVEIAALRHRLSGARGSTTQERGSL